MGLIEIFILIIFTYLLGSIPFAYILPKLFGFGDIRKIGSGNVGSTNVLRTGNKLLALVVLLCDILKGFLPFIYLENFFLIQEIKYFGMNQETIVYFISSLAILGHLFPVWLRFKGGKGVATYIGFLFGVNYFLAIVFIFCWLTIALLTKYSSLSSILSLVIIPFIFIYLFSTNFSTYCLFFIISLIVILKHYSNILRLFNKKENKIRF